MTFFDLIKSISKKEWLIILLIWIMIASLTLVPLLFSQDYTSNGYELSGIHTLSPGDMNVYFSYIRQAQSGRILFYNLFTTEIDQIPQFRIDWFIIGGFGKVFNLSPLFTYHTARIFLAAVLLVVLYLVLKYFIPKPKQTIIAFSFTSMVTGIGIWLFPWLDSLIDNIKVMWLPIDLWVSEAFVFLSIYHSPHLIFSWILILLTYLLFLLIWQQQISEKEKFLYSIIAGLVAGILFLAHPFHILPVYLLMGSYALFSYLFNWTKKNQWWYLLIIISISSIGVGYHVWYIIYDWTINLKAQQNFTPTPYLPIILIGFSLVLPLAIWQIYKISKDNKFFEKKIFFLLLWFLVQISLIFLPIPWQRRMMQGLQVPMNILFFIWWFDWVKGLKPKFDQTVMNFIWLVLVFVLFLPSSLYLIIKDSTYYKNKRYNYYYSQDISEAFDWIRENTALESRFFASMWMSNYIPGMTGRFSYAGHQIETMNYNTKEKIVSQFYNTSGINADHIYNWLVVEHIDYVIYSGYEKIYNNSFDGRSIGLSPVFENNEVIIYQVNDKK